MKDHKAVEGQTPDIEGQNKPLKNMNLGFINDYLFVLGFVFFCFFFLASVSDFLSLVAEITTTFFNSRKAEAQLVRAILNIKSIITDAFTVKH